MKWGMLPLLLRDGQELGLGDWVFLPGVRAALLAGAEAFPAYAVHEDGSVTELHLSTGPLTEEERQILADGCLINYYRAGR